MTPTALAFDPRQARLVQADTLTPHQHKTPIKLLTACDFRAQYMLKHPQLSEFHSLAEYLHAGLLEGDPLVTSYVPQPFRVRIRRRWYTADCYVVRAGIRRVLELKPRGEFDEAKRVPLTHFFMQHGMQFEVVSNESVYERWVEAETWLEIVRSLYLARDVDTTEVEYQLLTRFDQHPDYTLGELVEAGDRDRTYLEEIAVLRLLHQGHLAAKLTEQTLDWETALWLRPSAGANA